MTTQVQKDQIWQDNHVNRRDRKFKVEAILGDEALVKSVSGTDNPKFTKIKLERFKPRYYSLVKDSANTTTVVSKSVPTPATAPAPVAAPVLVGPPVGASMLLQDCCTHFPNVTWKAVAHTTDVVEATSGSFNIVIRKYKTDSYDIKIRVDGIIVDTWVANHLDLTTVLDSLKDRFRELSTDLTKFL